MGNYTRRDWNQELTQKGLEVGFEVIRWDGEPVKRNKVLIRCPHKEQWVYPHGQLLKKFCCKVGAKLGSNNAAFGKPSWNTGTVGISTGHGFGKKPKGEERNKPGTLYFVEYLDEDGLHLKVGITSKTIEQRLGKRLQKVLFSLDSTLGECWDKEQAFLEEFSEYRYSSCSTTELIQMKTLERAINYLREHK